MNIESLFVEWRPLFHSANGITGQQATRFIQQLFSAVESDQQVFDYLNVATYVTFKRNSWSDHVTLRPHKKAGWTLHLTLEGSGHYNCIRTQLNTQPGDILLFSPTAYIHKQLAEDCDEWNYSFVKFQANDRILDLLNWPEIASGIFHIKAESKQELEAVSSTIGFIAQQGWSSDASEVNIRSRLVEALLLRCNQIIESNGYQRTDSRLLTAVRYIDDHFTEELTVEKIARAACLSASALSKLFRKNYGISVMQWREEKRIAAACNKLIYSSLQVSQIASQLGYTNAMYFSRCFRRQMKMSPSEYKRLHQPGNDF
nr:AraC family transcriptional regulator [Endozoicomonas sp. OPT23]